MANTTGMILAFVCIFNILVTWAVAGRDIHANSKNPDVKHPESYPGYDGTVLIPGIGRVMVPKNKKGFNPYTYNPITGSNTGTGIAIPDIGSGGFGGGTDDNSIPFPGVDFTNPGSGGDVFTPPAAANP